MLIHKKYNDLQIRYFLDKEETLEEFQFNNGVFKITGTSVLHDLIPKNISPFWFCQQYTAIEKSTNEKIQAYIYYYNDSVSGKKVAVLNAIRPDK